MRAGSSTRGSEPRAEGDSQADRAALSPSSHSPIASSKAEKQVWATLTTRQISGDKAGHRSSWEAKSARPGWDQQGTRLDMAAPCQHWPVHRQLILNAVGEETTDCW